MPATPIFTHTTHKAALFTLAPGEIYVCIRALTPISVVCYGIVAVWVVGVLVVGVGMVVVVIIGGGAIVVAVLIGVILIHTNDRQLGGILLLRY